MSAPDCTNVAQRQADPQLNALCSCADAATAVVSLTDAYKHAWEQYNADVVSYGNFAKFWYAWKQMQQVTVNGVTKDYSPWKNWNFNPTYKTEGCYPRPKNSIGLTDCAQLPNPSRDAVTGECRAMAKSRGYRTLHPGSWLDYVADMANRQECGSTCSVFYPNTNVGQWFTCYRDPNTIAIEGAQYIKSMPETDLSDPLSKNWWSGSKPQYANYTVVYPKIPAPPTPPGIQAPAGIQINCCAMLLTNLQATTLTIDQLTQQCGTSVVTQPPPPSPVPDTTTPGTTPVTPTAPVTTPPVTTTKPDTTTPVTPTAPVTTPPVITTKPDTTTIPAPTTPATTTPPPTPPRVALTTTELGITIGLAILSVLAFIAVAVAAGTKHVIVAAIVFLLFMIPSAVFAGLIGSDVISV